MGKKLKGLLSRFIGADNFERTDKRETEAVSGEPPRPLTSQELDLFKRGMGITPHNYWTWAGKTKNFKLFTDGVYVWVEGFEDHKTKRLPMTHQKAWKWEFIKDRLKDFGLEG